MIQTKRTWKLVAVLVAALALAGACSRAAPATAIPRAQITALLTRSRTVARSPSAYSVTRALRYVDENGNYQGYDIELANRLGQTLE